MRRFTSFIMVIFAVLMLSGCSQKASTLPPNTFYSLVQSDYFHNHAQIYSFSKDGKQLDSRSIALQDGEYYALDESRNYYIAGTRANNNLLSIQGKQSFFHLLNNPHYTGSTAISFEKGITYSSMNGNLDEKEGYLSLLVARDVSTGKTLYKTIVPLFTDDMDIIGDTLYLTGSGHGPNHDSAVIISINKKTGEIISTYTYKHFSDFTSLVDLNDTLFLLGKSRLSPDNEIYTLNKDQVQELPHRQKGDVIGIYPCNEKLLILRNGSFNLIDSQGNILASYSDAKMLEGSHDVQIVDGIIYDIKVPYPDFDYDTTTITQFDAQTLKKLGSISLHVKRLPHQIVIVKPSLSPKKTTHETANRHQ